MSDNRQGPSKILTDLKMTAVIKALEKVLSNFESGQT